MLISFTIFIMLRFYSLCKRVEREKIFLFFFLLCILFLLLPYGQTCPISRILQNIISYMRWESISILWIFHGILNWNCCLDNKKKEEIVILYIVYVYGVFIETERVLQLHWFGFFFLCFVDDFKQKQMK